MSREPAGNPFRVRVFLGSEFSNPDPDPDLYPWENPRVYLYPCNALAEASRPYAGCFEYRAKFMKTFESGLRFFQCRFGEYASSDEIAKL
jgi:hypothetical protein